MDLNSYLSSPVALSVAQLRSRMAELGYVVKDDAQIRQWRVRYKGRQPSPKNCMGLELASGGVMRRQDLRPLDYWVVWPELQRPQVEKTFHE
ncbi:hypothetical protein [Achromobacter anxifer]|uniref:hypothetical protein n=1 Tax=Achromobacter anxifer TaxID=1287737 RepID=UPI0023F818EB|nr:hypothetical protein [Achromobacter anxifer]MDF8360187.1 hypothetical protein [Achromobacter anxifer]